MSQTADDRPVGLLYPQQNQKRNVLDLTGLWEFQLDTDGVGEGEGLARRVRCGLH